MHTVRVVSRCRMNLGPILSIIRRTFTTLKVQYAQ